MKHLIILILLASLFQSCKDKKEEIAKPISESNACSKGLMNTEWHERGIDEPIPTTIKLKEGFTILVDTNLKAKNFISFDENYRREKSKKIDTISFTYWKRPDDWDKLRTSQKINSVKKEINRLKQEADTIHIRNNKNQIQVWLLNNSNNVVKLQMEDECYVCVLQAKTRKGQWQPIQYWKFSDCGNSYSVKHILPKTANSFIMKIPNNGNYKTKLRFKMLGRYQFYYSNEFSGKIDYCEFFEDKSNYKNWSGKLTPHYKLDSLICIGCPAR